MGRSCSRAARSITRTLAAAEAAQLLEEMDPDYAADVVERLPTRDADAILIRMRPSEAAEIRELSVYPPDSAGGIMTPAFVAVARDASAQEAIAAIRRGEAGASAALIGADYLCLEFRDLAIFNDDESRRRAF